MNPFSNGDNNSLRAEPAAEQAAAEGERAKFEAWAESEGYATNLYEGQYASEQTEDAWLGWEACAARRPVRELTAAETNHLWQTIYDHGNGKYKGLASQAQREKAFSILAKAKE